MDLDNSPYLARIFGKIFELSPRANTKLNLCSNEKKHRLIVALHLVLALLDLAVVKCSFLEVCSLNISFGSFL